MYNAQSVLVFPECHNLASRMLVRKDRPRLGGKAHRSNTLDQTHVGYLGV